jgi:hypothetical protein
VIRAAAPPSSVIQPRCSPSKNDRKISNMFG